jgi:hypothetical protein
VPPVQGTLTSVHVPFSNAPGHTRENEVGRVEVWVDRAGWLLSRARGRFELTHCTELLVASDRAVKLAPRVRFVHDWREMTAFDVAVPPRLVGWVLGNVRAVEHSTIVTRSPLIAMAARAANVTLKNVLVIATDEAELQRALAPW